MGDFGPVVSETSLFRLEGVYWFDEFDARQASSGTCPVAVFYIGPSFPSAHRFIFVVRVKQCRSGSSRTGFGPWFLHDHPTEPTSCPCAIEPQCGAPKVAFSWSITPISPGLMVDISIVNGIINQLTSLAGAPPCELVT